MWSVGFLFSWPTCLRLPGQTCWPTPLLYLLLRFSRWVLCCRVRFHFYCSCLHDKTVFSHGQHSSLSILSILPPVHTLCLLSSCVGHLQFQLPCHDTTLSRPTCFFNRAHMSWRGSPRTCVSPLGRVWTALPPGDALAFIVVELKDIILLWLTFTLGCPSWQQPSSFLVLGLGPVNGLNDYYHQSGSWHLRPV